MARHFFWDPLEDNIIEEFDDVTNETVEYTTEPDYHGRPISMYRDGHTYTFHDDGRGNVIALTDENGNVTDTYSHTAFGKLVSHTGTTVNPFQWQGMNGYYTDEDGTVNVRRRQYNPALARWMSVDPLIYHLDRLTELLASIDPNYYRYVWNRPTAFSDPSGLAAEPFKFIAGRGTFKATLGPYDRSEDWWWLRREGSAFSLSWRPTRGVFNDSKGCCLCDSVGLVQIVRIRAWYAGIVAKHLWWWKIDHGIPYPYSSTCDPCYTSRKPIDFSRSSADMTDMPNMLTAEGFSDIFGPMLPGRRSFALYQDFEVCAMCLEGKEGPRMTPGPLSPEQLWNLPTIAVYGCVKWSHALICKGGKCKITRTLADQSETGTPGTVALSATLGGTAPSSNWTNLIHQHYHFSETPPIGP